MSKVNESDFGQRVKAALIRRNMTQEELTTAVANRTGLYFDSSYLWKVLTGVLKPPRVIEAITDILDLEAE